MPSRTKGERVDAVLDCRRRAKLRLIKCFGGGCGICGYNRSIRNLVFHHINPAEKMSSFGQFQSLAWRKVVAEATKCVMLCHNCHGEVHDGLITDLSGCPRLDESQIADYDPRKNGGPSGIRTHAELSLV